MSDATCPIVTQSPSQKLVALRLSLLMVKTAGTFTIGALMGLDWGQLSHQQQFLIVVAGIVALATAVEAFHDKTSARAEQGRETMRAGNTPSPFPAKL